MISTTAAAAGRALADAAGPAPAAADPAADPTPAVPAIGTNTAAAAPPAQIDEACQRHQAVLVAPREAAAGCGEYQVVWDARRDFDFAKLERLRVACREEVFPEALHDDDKSFVVEL
eukprot:2432363-Prymnesium_polylepis.1